MNSGYETEFLFDECRNSLGKVKFKGFRLSGSVISFFFFADQFVHIQEQIRRQKDANNEHDQIQNF